MHSPKKIFISAGESSGDILAAELALMLKKQAPGLKLFGVTGPNMQAAGVEPTADIRDFGQNGFIEVIQQAAHLRMMERHLLASIDHEPIDAAILVDFPGLHFQLAEQLRLRNIPVFQYIAPKVWAWGKGRIKNLKRDFELVLGIFPFEENFFHQNQVPFKYVGCPHVDRLAKIKASKDEFGFQSSERLVGILPGSRIDEIKKIMPELVAIMQELKQKFQEIHFLLPVAPSLELSFIDAYIPDSLKQQTRLIEGRSLEIMKAADCCIVTSGTATLECGLLGTPMVVLYKMSSGTYEIAKRKVDLPYYSLVNLVLEDEAMKEYIQHFSPQEVCQQTIKLLTPSPEKTQAHQDLDRLNDILKGNAVGKAANEILHHLERMHDFE